MSVDEFIAARVGQVVGDRWTLDRVLGAGGMAAVYAAHDTEGHVAAVKILHPEMCIRRDVRERFLREGVVANRIQHPGAVKVLEHGTVGDDFVYLVMELLVGETLGERVQRHGTLPVSEVLETLDQVLDVLAAAHEQGIVHRDLKPDNLFVTADGRVKVLDFGLARLLDAVPGDFKTRSGAALGTFPYMAPEQALGRRADIDGRADIFALGATAFRILARRKVHEAESDAELLMAMASKPAPALLSVAAHLPVPVAEVIDQSLAFTKEARYPDARTMQGDVRAVMAGHAPPYVQAKRAARTEPTAVPPVRRVPPTVPDDPGRDASPEPTVVDRAVSQAARAAGGLHGRGPEGPRPVTAALPALPLPAPTPSSRPDASGPASFVAPAVSVVPTSSGSAPAAVEAPGSYGSVAPASGVPAVGPPSWAGSLPPSVASPVSERRRSVVPIMIALAALAMVGFAAVVGALSLYFWGGSLAPGEASRAASAGEPQGSPRLLPSAWGTGLPSPSGSEPLAPPSAASARATPARRAGPASRPTAGGAPHGSASVGAAPPGTASGGGASQPGTASSVVPAPPPPPTASPPAQGRHNRPRSGPNPKNPKGGGRSGNDAE